jgi:integrase
MNNSQIQSIIKNEKVGRFKVDTCLYLRLTEQLTPTWVFRYSINSKRREKTIGVYGRLSEGKVTLSDARSEAVRLRSMVKKGIDPIAEEKRPALSDFKTVDDLANDWLTGLKIKNTQIPRRVYINDISPIIGEMAIERVSARDILGIIRAITDSGRPTIANDALRYCKKIFTHGIKLVIISNNPASPFTDQDAGGKELSRTRALTIGEVKRALGLFKANEFIFTRDNYLAVCLLLLLGVRKTELIAARWSEFDFEENTWLLPSERTKTGLPIAIPLVELSVKILKELENRSFDQNFVFPARRASKRRDYISDDTLNHALAKMFGKKVDSKKQPYKNLMADENIEYFTVHDLRRTFRSLLSSIGVDSYTAERCLNHKITGTGGIYDKYDYYPQRKAALTKLAGLLEPFIY